MTKFSKFSSIRPGFDIIGDIHGCYHTLCNLLETLGYQFVDGVYRYRDKENPRKVIFLGDVIDRGPFIREALNTVRQMVDADEAEMVLGNHEFHAVTYYMPRPDNPREFIRTHTPKHRQLLSATFAAFADYEEEWRDLRAWLLQQPIFIEHPTFRAVHACWDAPAISTFIEKYQRNTIDKDIIHAFSDKQSFEFTFLEHAMRGIEFTVPKQMSITGTDGQQRAHFRARFWLKNPQTYDEVIFRKHLLPSKLQGKELSPQQKAALAYYPPEEKPLFLGHYWLTGSPKLLAKNIVCADYSAVRNGQLVAYRFDNEAALSIEKFISVDRHEKDQPVKTG